MTNLALADPAWRLVSESAPTEVPPSGKKVTDQFVAELEKGKKGGRREKWSGKGGRKRGQFLILFTPRPASPGDPRDGSDNRACPSPDARRSTPPSSSSPPAGAPLKPTSLNPHLDRVLRSASCHRPSFNSVAMISSASASTVFSDFNKQRYLISLTVSCFYYF